ncbi:MAG: hypothetical protein CR971_02045 [candidate division SR1 bacterium]|nr:MAG: hypothetical protein CR971_02045 [candidate division SR1 bacterium]
MEELKYNQNLERKETLEKIKDYILSLIKKKQKQKIEAKTKPTKKDLQETISKQQEKNKGKSEKKKSWLDKIKEKFQEKLSNSENPQGGGG